MIKSAKLASFLKLSTFIVVLTLILAPAATLWGASQVISLTADSDDVEESGSGNVNSGSSDLEMCYGDGSNQTIGLRFNGINIPAGSTISNAYIQFQCDETTSGACTLAIHGEASATPASFTSTTNNVSSRSTTAASANWLPPSWSSGAAGVGQRTPDLSAVVQEIIEQGGWSSGNSMVFIITGTGTRTADAAGRGILTLNLEWTTFSHQVEFTQAESSGPENGSTVNIEVQLTGGNPGATVTVDYDITNISTASGDYSPYLGSGTLTFTNDTPRYIGVTLESDSIVEGDEQLLVTLSNLNNGGASVGLGAILQHTVTIIDNSPTVAFKQASSSGEEIDPTVTIEVVLNKSWPDPITVNYALNTSASTATSPQDFTLVPGTLTFDGVTSQFITVNITDDEYQESGETVVITLSNPSSNASLGTNSEHTFVINSSDINTDWPMWRYDANRGGAGPVDLPATMYKQWELKLPPLEQAFPDQGTRINYDKCYEPIVLGRTLFVASSATDSVTAYATSDAAVKWRFFADSPIRFAPVGWLDDPADPDDDKIFFASDDGHLYCINANDGTLIWKFRGAPATNRGLGNSRLGSLWPARGGPTLLDGKIYFSAGIWPFMGSFIYALDAATGNVVWVNDGSGSIYMAQPHSPSVSFSALAPQGYLSAVGDKLIVPNGRAEPGALDLATGEFKYFNFAAVNKSSSNYVAAYGNLFNNANTLFNISNGSNAGSLSNGAIMTATGNYTGAFCMAGDRLYKGSNNNVSATTTAGSTTWTGSISGTPLSMIAGDSKLFVVTQQGSIYCFGAVDVSTPPVINEVKATIAWPTEDSWTTMAQDILTASQAHEGYCLVLGVGTGRLMEELAREVENNQYDMYIIGLDPDAAKIKALREKWQGMGILNRHLSAFVGDICTEKLPPYLAHLIVSEDLVAAGKSNGPQFVEKVFYSLRPYGGTVCFPDTEQSMLQNGARLGKLANAEVTVSGDYALLKRVGALPDTDDWTHLYANASNTVVSRDKLVKAPLGLLWFGGSNNTNILPRHIHSPSEQVVGGRLFIEGANHMTARDVYTGRVIWERYLQNLGNYYYGASSSDPSHYSGSNVVGTNYVCAEDGVYIIFERDCLRLDPATGETISTFTLTEGAAAGAGFVQLRIWENLLIVGADPIIYSGAVGQFNRNETSCRELVVMDRYTGDVLWQRRANHSFIHNTIIIGKSGSQDTLYCIDRVPPGESDATSLKGVPAQNPSAPSELLAMDVWNEAGVPGGDVLWSTTTDVFGTWLGYSEQYDVLLQSGRAAGDTTSGEPTRQIAYTGAGIKLWEQGSSKGGPYLLHGDMVIAQNSSSADARNILTGATYNRVHPMTGSMTPWTLARTYGCNTAVGSEYLLTFRSGAASYYDMENNSGVGNFGGFKSSCTSNLIVANGVLNAPDYTRTCTCGYQNTTSLAMVHMPEAEMWTNATLGSPGSPVRKAGFNFGSPGDRLAGNGTFWLDYPSVGGASPNISVSISPTPSYFRHHGGRFEGEQMGWVTASGAIGATSVTVTLNNSSPKQYLVRLYFAEPEGKAIGERVFNVSLEGIEVLTDLDIAAEAGSEGEGIIKEFRGLMIDSALNVTLTPSAGVPVLCGIEVLEEISPDIDESLQVDAGDMMRLSDDWLNTGPFMPTDLYPDQVIDIWDFTTLSLYWMENPN